MYLDLTASAWLAFAAAAGLWLWSVRLTREAAGLHRLTWTAIPVSFFGLAWIAFGVTFVLRFIFLISDPKFFQATLYPLWRMPAAIFTWSWIALALYWLAFTLGYLLVVRLPPPRPVLLDKLDLMAAPENYLTLDVLVFCCSVLIVLTGLDVIPRVINTPLAILGSFYAIAAATAWFNYFQGHPLSLRPFLYLIPGILAYLYSPFRTLIFAVILCILVPALKTRRFRSLGAFLVGMLALLLVATIVNDYRRSSMDTGIFNRPAASFGEEIWGSKQQHIKPSWVRLVNRFHGFDSVALTVNLVPSFFPYSQLNIFADLAWRVIPRSIVDKKSETHRGRNFSTTIWAMGERGLTKREEANISPSMCADLYQINGILLVAVGAAFYGVLVGFLESWQQSRGPLGSSIILALFGTPAALGIEQEFDFAAATLIQVIIGLIFLLFFLPVMGQAKLPKKPVSLEPLERD